MVLKKWASDEDKAFHMIQTALEVEGYFLDDEALDKISELAQHVTNHPNTDSGWQRETISKEGK